MSYQRRVLARRNAMPQGLSADRELMLAAGVDVLGRLAADPTLDEFEHSLVRIRMVELQCMLALTTAKGRLASGDTAGAQQLLGRVVGYYRATEPRRALKLRATMIGLKYAPSLVALGYRTRQRMYQDC